MEFESINKIKIEKPKEGNSTTYLTHNFHTYPAKFIPQIPNATIKLLTKEGDIILDPFGGCGTTAVEAKLLNRNAIIVDINPIAVLVSKVKTTKLNRKKINKIDGILLKIKEDISNYYYNKNIKIKYKIPEFKNINHWFEEDVKNELAIIKYYLDTISDKDLKNYLYAAFSSIIVKVSNQESDTRYASINKNIDQFEVFETFLKKLKKMNERIINFSEKAFNSNIKVYEADARYLSFLENNSIDHIVTSPPYANTYDYYLYHKFRMVWLGYDVKKVQDNEIGSRNKHSSRKEGIETFEENLNLCLKEMSRVLKPNKYAVIVIGDSIIRGELIRVNKLLDNLAKNNNFKLVKCISYNLKKNTRMFNPKFTNGDKLEYIMFFKNEKRN